MKNSRLSKSTFIRGLQCEKSLYLHKYHYKLKDPITISQQAVFDQGKNIGLLAQKLFPNGVDASPKDYFNIAESVEKTLDFLGRGEKVIYEATFLYDDVLAALDILVKTSKGWQAYEVKSSTSVSLTNIADAAIQYYTIINSGIDIKDISIVYINNQYIKDGDLNIYKLFKVKSVYNEVLDYLPIIPNEIKRLKNIIESSDIPQTDIGPHCTEPYNCDFMGTCWKHIPEYSVFNISRLDKQKKFDLYNKGILTLDQINLDKINLNSNQLLQVKSELNQTTYIDKNKIRDFVNKLTFPLYFLDFETISSAIPLYNGSRPYQQVVFQYSLHIQRTLSSEIEHKEFLASPNQDPRISLIEQLISDCGSMGDILVYNIGFERGKLNDLIKVFPQYSDQLKGIVNRLRDLMIPFQKKWYYTPEMKGSYSIKYVLPALVPDLSYNELEIKDGGTASNTFLSMVNGKFEGNTEKTRKYLLEYCKLDTYAMVKILEKLQQV